MKQSLQLRLGQHLTMTPQLQQAIRLLQLSTLELSTEIQQALDSNMMLEVAEELDEEQEAEAQRAEEREQERGELAQETGQEVDDNDYDRDLQQRDEMPEELPVDSAWEDVYDTAPAAPASSLPDDDERGFEFGDTSSETLREHLTWQLRMGTFSDTDQRIAEAIIEAVDERGYLSMSLEELCEGLLPELEVELDEV